MESVPPIFSVPEMAIELNLRLPLSSQYGGKLKIKPIIEGWCIPSGNLT